MEYNWPLYQNSTTTGSSSGGVRGHNGHFSNPPPPAAWETTPPPPPPPSDYNNNLTVLKLGKRHYDSAAPPPRMNGNDPMCQVDGCDSVLLSAKEYHRRHKVCEVHAKAPMVLLRGIQQRFCQQCSRFHALTEFDESKRSCRRRLAGHNQRRRKSTTSQVGRRPQLLNSTECALSLLSSPPTTTNINYHPWAIISDDLPARCSAALRELIAENRASVLSHSRQQLNDNTYKHASFSRGDGHVTLDLMQDPSCIWGIDHHF